MYKKCLKSLSKDKLNNLNCFISSSFSNSTLLSLFDQFIVFYLGSFPIYKTNNPTISFKLVAKVILRNFQFCHLFNSLIELYPNNFVCKNIYVIFYSKLIMLE